MKRIDRIQSAMIALTIIGAATALSAADDPQPPSNRPNREELRERFKNMTPEERQARVKEFREKFNLGTTNRAEWEKRREELKNLPPAERQAKMRELREQLGPGRSRFNALSPEEREAKRKEMKARIDAQLSELQKKKTEGTLTETDQRRLERMEQMARRLEQGGALGPSRPSPAGRPFGSRPEKSIDNK